MAVDGREVEQRARRSPLWGVRRQGSGIGERPCTRTCALQHVTLSGNERLKRTSPLVAVEDGEPILALDHVAVLRIHAGQGVCHRCGLRVVVGYPVPTRHKGDGAVGLRSTTANELEHAGIGHSNLIHRPVIDVEVLAIPHTIVAIDKYALCLDRLHTVGHICKHAPDIHVVGLGVERHPVPPCAKHGGLFDLVGRLNAQRIGILAHEHIGAEGYGVRCGGNRIHDARAGVINLEGERRASVVGIAIHIE